ncbi:MAG: hypothetical protein JW969_15555 [Spirochaetales bacterium]|nr:hypothetical protein [Spirochaetales bacterium]
MKRFFCACLFILAVTYVHAEKLVYRENTGDTTIIDTYRIERDGNGYRIKLNSLINGESGWDITLKTDEEYSTLEWNFRFEREGTDFHAERTGNKIILKGVYKGKDVKKEYNINSHPWKQHFPFGLGKSLLNNKSVIFWGIGLRGQGELEAGEMIAQVEETTDLNFSGKSVPSMKVKISLTGWLSVFWHADTWFRSEDGRYLMYEAVNGPAGTPLTTILLEKEEN